MSFIFDLNKFTNVKVIEGEEMKKHTTICVGGVAKYFVLANSLYDVKQVIEISRDCGIKFLFLGRGSNLLFSDEGYDGVIISTPTLKDIYSTPNGICVSSAVDINKFIKYCIINGYSGIESLSGIPASIGGAIANNVSAFDCCISDCIKTVTVIKEGKLVKYNKEDCSFSYRKSYFRNRKEYIVSAEFVFSNKKSDLIENRAKEVLAKRNLYQPKGKSFGCVFKNPKGFSAGKLIEDAGLKGYEIGGAKISPVHANFIINNNNAKSSDIVELIEQVKKTIKKKNDISLKEEVQYINT